MTLQSRTRVHLAGNTLECHSGQIDRHAFNGRVANISYFLVEKIEKD